MRKISLAQWDVVKGPTASLFALLYGYMLPATTEHHATSSGGWVPFYIASLRPSIAPSSVCAVTIVWHYFPLDESIRHSECPTNQRTVEVAKCDDLEI